MSPERPSQQVAALRNGTVVDHLNSGMALRALQVLGVPEGGAALLGIHLESRKMGRKDILKLENVELGPSDIARLAVFGPHATVCLIRDYKVVKKLRVELPDAITGILRCPNPNCVTNHERIETRFDVESRGPIRVRCRYCERRILESEFVLS
jgi:aspartate carbamoyltransferase regulatory subunit